MLTFGEALVLLKSGEDMRHASWPRGTLLRALFVAGTPELRKFTGKVSSVYSPTQAEIFGQDWSKA